MFLVFLFRDRFRIHTKIKTKFSRSFWPKPSFHIFRLIPGNAIIQCKEPFWWLPHQCVPCIHHPENRHHLINHFYVKKRLRNARFNCPLFYETGIIFTSSTQWIFSNSIGEKRRQPPLKKICNPKEKKIVFKLDSVYFPIQLVKSGGSPHSLQAGTAMRWNPALKTTFTFWGFWTRFMFW